MYNPLCDVRMKCEYYCRNAEQNTPDLIYIYWIYRQNCFLSKRIKAVRKQIMRVIDDSSFQERIHVGLHLDTKLSNI